MRGREAIVPQRRRRVPPQFSWVDLPVAVKLAQGLPGRFPAKAIALLDQAASTASLLRAPLVSPDDLFSVARQFRVEGECERNADGSTGSET